MTDEKIDYETNTGFGGLSAKDKAVMNKQRNADEKIDAKRHRWNEDGETCLDCGDSDWMNDPVCKPRPQAQSGDAQNILNDIEIHLVNGGTLDYHWLDRLYAIRAALSQAQGVDLTQHLVDENKFGGSEGENWGEGYNDALREIAAKYPHLFTLEEIRKSK